LLLLACATIAVALVGQVQALMHASVQDEASP
jgi:hypothetical protein